MLYTKKFSAIRALKGQRFLFATIFAFHTIHIL